MSVSYRQLCGITGIAMIFIGPVLVALMLIFLATGQSPIPVDGVGHYFIAFSGSGLVTWGLSLQAASRDANMAHSLAPANTIGMVCVSLYRLVINLGSADVRAWVGWIPAGEAFLFGALAIAFWQGRPKRI